MKIRAEKTKLNDKIGGMYTQIRAQNYDKFDNKFRGSADIISKANLEYKT